MILALLIFFLHALATSAQYSQQRELLQGGKLTLAWGVEGERLHFKLVSAASKSVVLLFSYSDVPTDGMIVGQSEDGAQVGRDLHLDFAGIRVVMLIVSTTFYINKCLKTLEPISTTWCQMQRKM